MRDSKHLFTEPSEAWMNVLKQYRERYTNKNITVSYKREIKRDFYNFRSEFKEEYVDWCWGYIAIGRFGG